MIPDFDVSGPEDAASLVLAHSLGCDRSLWDGQLPALAARFRVIRYDVRGAPLQDLAADVVDLLDHLGVARAHFAGISLGGMVGMALAAGAPGRVDRLVLCATSARLGPPSHWRDRAARARADGMPALAEGVLSRWFTPAFAAAHPEIVKRFARTLESRDPDDYAAACEAIAEMDLTGDLAAITAPTLVITGSEDPSTPLEHGLSIAASVPQARYLEIPGASHLVNIEQPLRFAAAVLDHLAGGEQWARGDRVRREVLGDDHVNRSAAGVTGLTADFQRYLTSAAWGEVWTRPGLDRRTRSCITVAMLIALGRDEELALHLRAARRNGVTTAELQEVLLQAAVYCGVPAANHAFAIAREVLDE